VAAAALSNQVLWLIGEPVDPTPEIRRGTNSRTSQRRAKAVVSHGITQATIGPSHQKISTPPTDLPMQKALSDRSPTSLICPAPPSLASFFASSSFAISSLTPLA